MNLTERLFGTPRERGPIPEHVVNQRRALSARESAKRRQCPSCERLAGLVARRLPLTRTLIQQCRWCGYRSDRDAAADRLATYGEHASECAAADGYGHCTCGFTEAWVAWNAAKAGDA